MLSTTGVPRNSPVPEPLVPLAHQIQKMNTKSAIPGSPGGFLDLSNIQKVTGTNRAGMFVSTAVLGEGSHHHFQQQHQHHGTNNPFSNTNNRNNSTSPSSTSARRRHNHSNNPHEESARRRREKYEQQQRLLQERSPVVSTAVNVRDNADLQMRFAASIMPSGSRGVQPLPDFLDSSFGFQATLDTAKPVKVHHHHYQDQVADNNNNNNKVNTNYLSMAKVDNASFIIDTSSAIDNRHENHNISTGNFASPSPIPTTVKTSSKYLFSPSTNQNKLSRQRSANRSSSKNNKNNSNMMIMSSSSSSRRTGGGVGGGLGGKANRIVCCPVEHAVTGHLAQGIVIGTCERQAMEQYLQVSRELELERESRATDKWKAELELVKALNRSQDLEKQVEKLTEIVENPRPLHEAKLLRQEFENRWKQAQLRVEELENQKVSDGKEEEELRLKLLQKEHECAGLKAAVRRMETTDKNHDEELAEWRKKWFDQKAEKEKQMGIVAELEKHISRLNYENKSLRGAIRGLEQRLILSSRRDKISNNSSSSRSPIPSSNSSSNHQLFAAGSPANAISLQQQQQNNNYLTSARSKSSGRSRSAVMNSNSNGSVQLNDLDAAVRVLMHAYSSPGQSPLKMRPTLDTSRFGGGVGGGGNHQRGASPPLSSSRSILGAGILSHMTNKAMKETNNASIGGGGVILGTGQKNVLDNLMIKTSVASATTTPVLLSEKESRSGSDSPTRKL